MLKLSQLFSHFLFLGGSHWVLLVVVMVGRRSYDRCWQLEVCVDTTVIKGSCTVRCQPTGPQITLKYKATESYRPYKFGKLTWIVRQKLSKDIARNEYK